jgi:hypothetical protein
MTSSQASRYRGLKHDDTNVNPGLAQEIELMVGEHYSSADIQNCITKTRTVGLGDP